MNSHNLKLTDHLLSLNTTPTYSAATQHSFLTLAGRGDLPLSRLALWLSQDRIYAAHAYPRFIGALISRIPFHSSDPIDGVEDQFKQRLLHVLVQCLDNIVLEVEFFKNTATEFQLHMDGWMERKGTRDYTAEMARISLSSSPEEGIVFLWAMEKVYFDAWSYVKRLLQELPADDLAAMSSTGAIEKFATNWSSPEFGVFVETLAGLVDKLDIKPGTDLWHRVEGVWTRVIELEVGFWPNDGEEIMMKKNQCAIFS